MKAIRPLTPKPVIYEIAGTKTVPLGATRTQTMIQATYIDRHGDSSSALLGASIELYETTPNNMVLVKKLEEIYVAINDLEEEAEKVVNSFKDRVTIEKVQSSTGKVN